MPLPALPLAVLAALASSIPAQDDAERAQAWSEDLFHLVDRLVELHPDPWSGVPREEFEEAVGALYERLPELSDDQVLVELMRLFGLHSRAGREGHCGIWPPPHGGALPVRFYRFADGWFVVGGNGEHAALAGARLVAVEGTPVEEVVAALSPLFTWDSPETLLVKNAAGLRLARVLHGLGIAASADAVELELEQEGERRSVRLAASSPGGLEIAPPPDPEVLWLADPTEAWWRRALPERDALYVQYNATRATNDAGQGLAAFAADTVRELEERGLGRLVLDVRSNRGGDNTTFGPLVAALAASPVNRPGGLYVLLGRGTFSAAGNFAAAIEQGTEAILVGEPAGGGPNQFGDAESVVLPNHPELLVLISTRWHEFAPGEDERLTTPPDLAVPLTSADWLAKRDPVLERALTHVP